MKVHSVKRTRVQAAVHMLDMEVLRLIDRLKDLSQELNDENLQVVVENLRQARPHLRRYLHTTG